MKLKIILLFFITSISFAQAQNNCKLLYKISGKESAYPRLSKDKKSILYQSNNSGKWQLMVMEISTNKHKTITTHNSNNNFPDWSSDNQWISFVSDRDGNEEIYLMKSDGTGLKRISNNAARDIHPYFSPDAKYILFNSTRGNGSLGIYKYTIASGKTELEIDSKDNETCGRYSPDMKKIVYLKNNDFQDDIYVMDIITKKAINISNTSSVYHGWPMFSPDGKYVYYSSMESGDYSIYKIKPDGTGKLKITNPKGGEEDARVNISADGKLMIYNKQIGKTIEIWQCSLG